MEELWWYSRSANDGFRQAQWRSPPKLPNALAVIDFIKQYPNELEADFFQFYNLDIAEIGTPHLSYLRVGRLLIALPPESRIMRKLTEQPIAWTPQLELLASIIDAIQQNTWVNVAKEVKPSQRAKPPKRYPRPEDIKNIKEGKKATNDLHRKLLEQRERLSIGKSDIQSGLSGGGELAQGE